MRKGTSYSFILSIYLFLVIFAVKSVTEIVKPVYHTYSTRTI